MKTVLLDVDGVIADCMTPVHRAAEGILGRPLPRPDQWEHFEFKDALQLDSREDELLHQALLSDDRVGREILLYPGAYKFVKTLSRHADVVFVTSHWRRMPHWVPARDALLENCFPGLDIVYTHSKTRVLGDVLVDDKPKNILENRHRGLLFSRPWNRHAVGLKRVESYEQILEMLV